MEMESRHLAAMFIGLGVGLISIGCCLFTSQQWGSILVVWYVIQTKSSSVISLLSAFIVYTLHI